MSIDRREFLVRSAAVASGFAGLGLFFGRTGFARVGPSTVSPYGELETDPHGILDLPAGFTYSVVSRAGDTMSDTLLVPGQPDGMCAFAGANGTTILIRNHENDASDRRISPFGSKGEIPASIDAGRIFDRGSKVPIAGGCTKVVYDTRTGQKIREHLVLAGTMYNCAGGPTPWGSWLSCEEDVSRAGGAFLLDHGYVFEVPSSADELVKPLPIKDMGRFRHEAVAIDPRTGIVYLSEDRDEGLVYRYIPKERQNLLAGGRLQALMLVDRPAYDTRNWKFRAVEVGDRFAAKWVDLEGIDAPADDLRFRGRDAGAAVFARTEGMWFGNGKVYFAATSGGNARRGQIWRYAPAADEGQANQKAGELDLFIEPNDQAVLDMCDNITFSPWGDLVVCEDGEGDNFIRGVTPAGDVYPFARNALNSSEFAGACFSPDGSTMFANMQSAGLTLAIRGPWKTGAKVTGS